MPIICYLIAGIIGALGQYLYKLGGNLLGTIPIYKNWQLFGGAALFCLVMVLFVAGFKMGGRLGVIYPIYATTFIWGLLIAVLWDHEPWNAIQVFGIGLIVVGVSVIAIGAPR
jgi:drug/metabolite transporter (DMT)-like permease